MLWGYAFILAPVLTSVHNLSESYDHVVTVRCVVTILPSKMTDSLSFFKSRPSHIKLQGFSSFFIGTRMEIGYINIIGYTIYLHSYNYR